MISDYSMWINIKKKNNDQRICFRCEIPIISRRSTTTRKIGSRYFPLVIMI